MNMCGCVCMCVAATKLLPFRTIHILIQKPIITIPIFHFLFSDEEHIIIFWQNVFGIFSHLITPHSFVRSPGTSSICIMSLYTHFLHLFTIVIPKIQGLCVQSRVRGKHSATCDEMIFAMDTRDHTHN